MVDDKTFEAYLRGDSSVSQRYREDSSAELPSELDQKILANARAAVAPPARSRTWMRWTAPLAVAASAIIVLSIVLDAGVREQAEVSAVATSAQEFPQPPRQSSGADHALEESQLDRVAPPAIEAPPAAPPPAAAPQAARQSMEQLDQSAAAQARKSEPAPRGAAEARRATGERASRGDELEQVIVQSSSLRRQETQSAAFGIDSARVQVQTPDAAPSFEPVDPERWLQDIRDLRNRGETAAADREWERFRSEHPNYEVAQNDLARTQEQAGSAPREDPED